MSIIAGPCYTLAVPLCDLSGVSLYYFFGNMISGKTFLMIIFTSSLVVNLSYVWIRYMYVLWVRYGGFEEWLCD